LSFFIRLENRLKIPIYIVILDKPDFVVIMDTKTLMWNMRFIWAKCKLLFSKKCRFFENRRIFVIQKTFLWK
jgi:hypothetical protein